MMELNVEWRRWLNENLERGCQPEELVIILLQNGFNLIHIEKEMGENFPNIPIKVLNQANKNIDISDIHVDFQSLASVAITKNQHAEKIAKEGVQLYLLPNFMSSNECNLAIELINKKLHPSEVTMCNGDKSFRTSKTCYLGIQDSEFITEIDNKIADALGISIKYSELIQGQKYVLNQEFKAHVDYFSPNSDEYVKFAKELGQRTWTFMVYLNDTELGGQTSFTELGIDIFPNKGTAVIWNNLTVNGEVNTLTKHHAKPVNKGEKYVITKWFRTKLNPHF